MRLFVAVWPSSDVRAALESLPRPDHPSVRWTPPHQWHVTLRFLGDVDGTTLPAVADALRGAAQHWSPRLAELGPSTARLGRGVLVVPVAGLRDLGRGAADATSRFGQPPPERPFRGHVTLARGRGRSSVPAHLAGQPVGISWQVGELAVVRSRLGPGVPRYDVVATIELSGGPTSRSAPPPRVSAAPAR
ncbi:MAG: RNA 2',3'-cyclic phosphodiesterase [Acidimicrobiales bacterium]